MRALFAAVFALSLVACGAGPYGHAPHYVPLSEEQNAVAAAREYDPVMFQRQPDEWKKGHVSLFGIVTHRAPGPSGATALTLGVRRLEPRNLCESMRDDSTCRVTVSDREFGLVHVLVTLRPDDDVGERSVGVGSLLRVVASSGGEVDPQDGAAVLRASYYRHWPRYFYVTKAAARDLRQ
ncbi:MAG: hypothetical protein IPG50_14395 [Myxococcales bacterium]|nr:hypothetical protein [Myxococcales bacterium]